MNTFNHNGSMENSQDYNAESMNQNFRDNLNDAFGIDEKAPAPLVDLKNLPDVKANKMNNQLKTQTNETDKNLDLLLRNASEVDEKTKDLLMKNRNLIQQLFPSKMDKMIMEMQGNTIQNAMEFRLNLYKMSTQFRLEALREKYNASLMTIRGHYREQVSDFMMTKLLELAHKVKAKEQEFFALSQSKLDFAAKQNGYPSLQAIYLRGIDEEYNNFQIFLHRQISSFQSIIDEQIERIQ